MQPKPNWKEHQLTKSGVVEELPLEWVWQYWTSDVNNHIELEDGSHMELEELWKVLIEEGMSDPLILRVGLENKRMRLEAGNHRIQVLRQHGVKFVPVTVQVRHLCGDNAPGPMTNGTIDFPFPDSGLKISEITEEYMKPSDVFWSTEL